MTSTTEYPVLGYGSFERSRWHVDKWIGSAGQACLTALLRRIRDEAGITQVQVAKSLGVPQSFVSKYESGERRLDVIELEQIAACSG